MNRRTWVTLAMAAFLISGCATTFSFGSTSGGFSIKVVSGTVHLHVESKMTKKPDQPLFVGSAKSNDKENQVPATAVEVLNSDLELSAGRGYTYTLGQNENFGASVERIGEASVTYEVTINGITKAESIEKGNLIGKVYSVSTVR